MPNSLSRKKISALLPQEGFLLLPQKFVSYCKKSPHVDEIVGIGTMRLRKNSIWLKNHFGIAPGIMFIELLNQTAALLAIVELGITDKMPVALRLQDPPPKFGMRPVTFGDVLVAKARLTKNRRGMFYFEGSVFTGNDMILETGIVGAAVQKDQIMPPAKRSTESFALTNITPIVA